MSEPPVVRTVHAIAALLPEPTQEEFEALKNDIKKNGQRMPILVTPKGELVDGRSRLRACQELGLPPKLEVFEGDNVIGLVCSLNLLRRHLTSSQRATLALETLPQFEKEARDRQRQGPGRVAQKLPEQIPEGSVTRRSRLLKGGEPPEKGEAKELAAQLFSTNRKYITEAAELKKESPELFAEVRKGSMSIPEAKQKLSRDIASETRKVVRAIAERVRESVQERNEKVKLENDRVVAGEPYWVAWAKSAHQKLEETMEVFAGVAMAGSNLLIQLEEHASLRRKLVKAMERTEATLREAKAVLMKKSEEKS